MHSALYDHLLKYVYKGMNIASASPTSVPSEFLARLLDVMPLKITAGADFYMMNGFMHFIDVATGAYEVVGSGSSYNTGEVEAADALATHLIAAGTPAQSIATVTGYQTQVKRLQIMIKERQLLGVKVLTINLVRGRSLHRL